MNVKKIQSQLFEMKDDEYKKFHAKLIPNIDSDTIIGVRTPALRKFANEVYKSREYDEFFNTLPHEYYEENNLHGFLIEKIRDYDDCIQEIERFLPYIDNWATCDLMNPKIFQKHLNELLKSIKKWMASENVYTIRFGIGMLMRYYLDDFFEEEYLQWVCEIRHEDYYVKMMAAWYFATALSKQYDTAVGYIEAQKLDKWTHNKAIQKAIESYRVTDERKTYLRSLKIK